MESEFESEVVFEDLFAVGLYFGLVSVFVVSHGDATASENKHVDTICIGKGSVGKDRADDNSPRTPGTVVKSSIRTSTNRDRRSRLCIVRCKRMTRIYGYRQKNGKNSGGLYCVVL